MAQQGDMTGVLIHTPPVRRAGTAVLPGVRACISGIYKAVSSFLLNLQIGRMDSVLRRMSDEELNQIGITRKGIPHHAKFLVTYDYDGL